MSKEIPDVLALRFPVGSFGKTSKLYKLAWEITARIQQASLHGKKSLLWQKKKQEKRQTWDLYIIYAAWSSDCNQRGTKWREKRKKQILNFISGTISQTIDSKIVSAHITIITISSVSSLIEAKCVVYYQFWPIWTQSDTKMENSMQLQRVRCPTKT